MNRTVDIVLPCYNPGNSWHHELMDFYNQVKELYAVNFVIVNDGSFSGNVSVAIEALKQNKIPVNYISYEKNRGKGYALRKGVTASTGEFMIYTDIDFPFTNDSALKLIQSLVNEKSDIVAGYRDNGYYEKKMSGFRRVLSKAFRFFIKDFLKLAVSDTQCGLKGFNRKGKEKFLSTKIDRYLFDFEFIYLSCKDSTITISTVMVQLKDNVVFSKMKLKILIQETFNLLYILIFRKPN
jgi:glycosyltransferase involved in cell wall biosynthesis